MDGGSGACAYKDVAALARRAMFAFDGLLGAPLQRLPPVPTLFGGRLSVPVRLQLGEVFVQEEGLRDNVSKPCVGDGRLGPEGLGVHGSLSHHTSIKDWRPAM